MSRAPIAMADARAVVARIKAEVAESHARDMEQYQQAMTEAPGAVRELRARAARRRPA